MSSTTADWLPGETIMPGLPNEVALLCLARVPIKCHPVLAAVSKPIRSIVKSPEFLALRSNLNCSEEVLYILARSSIDTVPEIFALHGNRLAPVPPPPVPSLLHAPSVAVGHRIYVIGGWTGKINSGPSSTVWVLDCRSGTWSRGPDMIRPRRKCALASVIGGKIFVVGGLEERVGPIVEVLDTEAAEVAWEAVPEPPQYTMSDYYDYGEQSLALGGKVHIRRWDWGEKLILDAATLTWELSLGPMFGEQKFLNGYPAEDGMWERIHWLQRTTKGPVSWKVERAGGRHVLMGGSNEKMLVYCKDFTVGIENLACTWHVPGGSVVVYGC